MKMKRRRIASGMIYFGELIKRDGHDISKNDALIRFNIETDSNGIVLTK